MSHTRPQISDHELYQLLREERHDEFNRRWAAGDRCDLSNKDFRGIDLRRFQIGGIDFSNGYFRGADLRGLDLSSCVLKGASIRDANISGTLFPQELSPAEIMMSLQHGTRLRYRSGV